MLDGVDRAVDARFLRGPYDGAVGSLPSPAPASVQMHFLDELVTYRYAGTMDFVAYYAFVPAACAAA